MKILIVLLICLSLFSGEDKRYSSTVQNSIVSIIDEYRNCDEFEILKLGPLATGMLKTIIKASAEKSDDDVRDIIAMVQGVDRIIIVDYEGCSADVRRKFTSELEEALSPDALLMQVNDGEDEMKMYGMLSEDSSMLNNFFLYNPDGGALICLFGDISVDAFSKIAGSDR